MDHCLNDACSDALARAQRADCGARGEPRATSVRRAAWAVRRGRGPATRAGGGGPGPLSPLSPLREPAAAAMEMEHFIDTVRKYPCLWNTTAIEYRDQELKDAAWAEVMKDSDLSSVKEVKLKWKKLRDSYRDALKRQNDMLAKDPGNSAKKNYPWKYMGLMQFLQPHMSVRKKPAESPHYVADAPQPGGGGGGAHGQHSHPSQHAQHYQHSQHSQHAHNGDGRSSSDSDSEPESSGKRKSCSRLTLIDRKLDFLCKAQSKRRFTDAHLQERQHPPAAPDPLDIFFNSMCQSTKRFPYPAQINIKKTLFGAVIEAEEALLAEQQSYASLWARGADTSASSEPDDPDDQDRKPS